jgi:putative acetyltransferase
MVRIDEASTPRHYEIALELVREYAATLGHDLTFQIFQDEIADLKSAYGPPTGRLLLAEIDGVPAGCVALRGRDGGACEMKRMFVRPAFRGRGLGRRLAEAVIAAARELGYERMRLDTLAHMHVPRTLYRSLGFVEVEPYYHNPLPGAVYFELDFRSIAER